MLEVLPLLGFQADEKTVREFLVELIREEPELSAKSPPKFFG